MLKNKIFQMETLIVHSDSNNIKELKEILDKMQINYNTFNDDATHIIKLLWKKWMKV